MNKPLVVANWKMNKTISEATEYTNKIKGSKKISIVLCPSFVALSAVHDKLKGRSIKLGAQNIHYQDSGNFTGEISPLMLKSAGCEYVIIGHSERRILFNENDDSINNKVLVSISYGLKVVLCVGETLEAMRNGISEDYISIQLSQDLYRVKNFENITIVYEPVWSIQNGMEVNTEHINKMIHFIHNFLKSTFSIKPVIIYGGDINKNNIISIYKIENLSGFLFQEAALDYKNFNNLIKTIESSNES
ncbi:triose-phosphate isomerase [Candidatus Dojkabacteria bacterium]|nr:triose-phosphate isomerase [Candidatus Dojkabacteria bacterium]